MLTWQHVLPERQVEVVEDVALCVYIVEALGGEAQRALIVHHDLQNLCEEVWPSYHVCIKHDHHLHAHPGIFC
jgi:hypothetical protein